MRTVSDVSSAAVVGANGFVGSALVARLRSRSVPVARFTRDVPLVSDLGLLVPEAAEATTLYWLAASVNPAVAEEHPELVEADHDAFTRFLAAAERTPNPPRVALLSSGGTVYDPATSPPYTEDSPVGPTTAYGRSKVGLEQALLGSQLPGGHKLVARVANVYGPGQPARRGQGVIAHWLQAAASGDPLVIIGDPRTVRDYVYIDDVVDLLEILHTITRPLPDVVNVGSGEATSLEDLAKVVLDAISDPEVAFERTPPRDFDLSQTWLEISRAERDLGWRPRTELADGVARAWAAVKRRRADELGTAQAS